MKVYIVTQGDYSDYHIEQVFSTREKAQEYIDHTGYDNSWIEEYDVDEEVPRGTFLYLVVMYDNDWPATASLLASDSVKDTVHYDHNTTYFTIEAKDAPHAVKIASERFMQIKAMPYLFPRLKEECVCLRNGLGYVLKSCPVYDYNTKEIILGEDEYLE